AEIARRADCCEQTVRNWRRRWPERQSLRDAERRGCPRKITAIERAAVTALACSSPREPGEVSGALDGGSTRQSVSQRGLSQNDLWQPRATVAARREDPALAGSLVATVNRS